MFWILPGLWEGSVVKEHVPPLVFAKDAVLHVLLDGVHRLACCDPWDKLVFQAWAVKRWSLVIVVRYRHRLVGSASPMQYVLDKIHASSQFHIIDQAGTNKKPRRQLCATEHLILLPSPLWDLANEVVRAIRVAKRDVVPGGQPLPITLEPNPEAPRAWVPFWH